MGYANWEHADSHRPRCRARTHPLYWALHKCQSTLSIQYNQRTVVLTDRVTKLPANPGVENRLLDE
jgi:hypothetical protein